MAAKTSTGKYVVRHTAVDTHPEGTFLYAHDSPEDFGEKKWKDGARKFDTYEQQERLVLVGAVSDLTAEEEEAAGENALRLAGPIPSGFPPPVPSKKEYEVMKGAQAKAKAEAEKAAAPPHGGSTPAGGHPGHVGGTAAKPK
jgi:hypothetical protein